MADRITNHVTEKYVKPARARGDAVFWVKAKDVHEALGLVNSYPTVCSKLGSNAFQNATRSQRIAVDGPTNGANSFWVYRLLE